MKFFTLAGLTCVTTLTMSILTGCQSSSFTSSGNQSGSQQTKTQSQTSSNTVQYVSPNSLSFPTTVIGDTATSRSLTINNTGSEAISLSGTGLGISITGTDAGSFSQTSQCGASVAPGSSCSISVAFTPTRAGRSIASFSVVTNVSTTPWTVSLNGYGTYPIASLSSPASLTFASTPIGMVSATQVITLNNTGIEALSLSGTGYGISITGTNAASFSQTNQCGTSLAVGASCAITVTFAPVTEGSLNASVIIADNAQGQPQTVPLNGTGIAASGDNSSGVGNIYYVDNSIPDIHVASSTPDCTTYSPVNYLCGSGSATAYATVADVNALSLKPGDSVYFRRGKIWREELVIYKKSGSPWMPITFGAYGDNSSPLPIVSGANQIMNWTPESISVSGNAITVYSAPYSVFPGDGYNYDRIPYANIPNQVFEDGVRLTKNTIGNNSIEAGQWFLDKEKSEIMVRLSGDEDPNEHVIDATQRQVSVILFLSSNVIISNIQAMYASVSGVRLDTNNDNDVISNVIANNNYYYGISLCYSSNVHILSSTIAYNGNDGISSYENQSTLIDGNTIHGNDLLWPINAFPGSPPSGIHIGANFEDGERGTNTIVQNNLIYSNGILGTIPASGIDIDSDRDGDVVRYNRIYSNGWDGIELDADNKGTVYGNVVYGNGDYGIRAFADGKPSMSEHYIFNNTVYGNYIGGITLSGPYTGSTKGGCMNNQVVNNIAVGSITGANLYILNGCENPGEDGSGNVYTNNALGAESDKFIVWGRQPNSNKLLYESTYQAWETAANSCGAVGCTRSVESDPQFTSISTNDFSIKDSSPVIGAGLNVGNTYQEGLDMNSTWPLKVLLDSQGDFGGGWTIGAYVYTD